MKKKENNLDNSRIDDKAVYEKMLETLDVPEIYNLCKQVSEKFLSEDNDLYEYFHKFDNGDLQ
jgi:hypothetical protein